MDECERRSEHVLTSQPPPSFPGSHFQGPETVHAGAWPAAAQAAEQEPSVSTGLGWGLGAGCCLLVLHCTGYTPRSRSSGTPTSSLQGGADSCPRSGGDT